jgi:hypothetical protein
MAQVESIRRAMHMQPFRPFQLKLVDGTLYTVQHHDWLSIPPVRRRREVTFYAVTDDKGEDYETHRIDLNLILEVIVPPGAAPAHVGSKTRGSPQ